MKKLILLLLLFLSFIGFSYAGGDDRDLQEFLDKPAEVVEEEAKQVSENEDGNSNKVAEELEHQPQKNEKAINETTDNDKKENRTAIEVIKEDYIESYQGGFMMLSIFILILIISMYFSRR
jgi:hypothetical protein